MSILETLQRPTSSNGSSKTHSRHATGKQSDPPPTASSCRSDTTASAAELRDRAVEDQANAVLRSSSYHPVRRVTCEVRQRVLILRGRVPSFHMKQIAQTVVRNLLHDGLAIDNRVEVDRN